MVDEEKARLARQGIEAAALLEPGKIESVSETARDTALEGLAAIGRLTGAEERRAALLAETPLRGVRPGLGWSLCAVAHSRVTFSPGGSTLGAPSYRSARSSPWETCRQSFSRLERRSSARGLDLGGGAG